MYKGLFFNIFDIMESRLINSFQDLLMAYLITGSYQISIRLSAPLQRGQCCAKGSMPGMAVRKVRSLFASYHRHGTKESFWLRKPNAEFSNYRTGHCVRTSRRAPVRGFRALASVFPPVTRLIADYTRRLHY